MKNDAYKTEIKRKRKISEMKETIANVTYGEYEELLDDLENKNALLQASFEEINRLNGIYIDEDILYIKEKGLLNYKYEIRYLELGAINEDFWYKLTASSECGRSVYIERYKKIDSIEVNKEKIIYSLGVNEECITKIIDEERKLYLLIY